MHTDFERKLSATSNNLKLLKASIRSIIEWIDLILTDRYIDNSYKINDQSHNLVPRV